MRSPNDYEPTQPVRPVEPVQPVQPVQPVAPVSRPNPAYRASQVVYLVLGIVEALLIIRFVLKLLGANPDAAFSSLVYGVTEPLVMLFEGVFPNAAARGSVLDLAALLAMIVYALVAWAIVKIIEIMARRRTTYPA